MCLEPLLPSFPFVPGPCVLAVVVVKDVRVVFEIVPLNIESCDLEFEMNLEQFQTNIRNSSLTTLTYSYERERHQRGLETWTRPEP